MIDGSPQVHAAPGNTDHHFVQVPSVIRSRRALTQIARDQRTEFKDPLAQALVGGVNAALGQEFFDITVAKREA